LAALVSRELKDSLACPGCVETLELLALRAMLELLAQTVYLAYLETRDQWEILDHLEWMGHQVSKATLERLVLQETLGQQATLDDLATVGQMADQVS